VTSHSEHVEESHELVVTTLGGRLMRLSWDEDGDLVIILDDDDLYDVMLYTEDAAQVGAFIVRGPGTLDDDRGAYTRRPPQVADGDTKTRSE